MRKIKIKSLWKPSFLGEKDKKGKFGIYSPALTENILHYERSRADREGGCFSLVLFKVSESDARNSRLVNILKNGTRFIDHLGWYDKNSICVILTATGLEGAHLFVEKINSGIEMHYNNGRRPVYTYELFSYPSMDGKRKLKEESSAIYRENQLCINEILKHQFGIKIPVWKRSIDIIGALFGIILFTPLFLCLSAFIKIVSKGPIFYKQTRVGFKGGNFTFYKFRTMHNGNNENFHTDHAHNFISKSDVPMEKLDVQDPRIIPGGKILRKACIDELPQLFNVLKGDMSLVGPRPCIPYEAERYRRWHAQRFDIMPGMTGLWQVSGKNKLSFHTMVSLDITYLRRISLWFDLKLIFLTIPAIIGMVLEGVKIKIKEKQKVYS